MPGAAGMPVQKSDILRSIALVVDDIGMSFENLVYVKQSLKGFVAEQIQPTDLVAISLTSAKAARFGNALGPLCDAVHCY
jgi:hypothetical protein